MSDPHPGRADYPLLTKDVTRLIIEQPAFADVSYPEGLCGVSFWAEFPDPGTARAFRTALYEFARSWEAP